MKEWRGITREKIQWYTAIDAEKCIGCKDCVEFCKNEVLEFDETTQKTLVKNSYNCVVECRTCARICSTAAISFPDEEAFITYIKEKLAINLKTLISLTEEIVVIYDYIVILYGRNE